MGKIWNKHSRKGYSKCKHRRLNPVDKAVNESAKSLTRNLCRLPQGYAQSTIESTDSRLRQFIRYVEEYKLADEHGLVTIWSLRDFCLLLIEMDVSSVLNYCSNTLKFLIMQDKLVA